MKHKRGTALISFWTNHCTKSLKRFCPITFLTRNLMQFSTENNIKFTFSEKMLTTHIDLRECNESNPRLWNEEKWILRREQWWQKWKKRRFCPNIHATQLVVRPHINMHYTLNSVCHTTALLTTSLNIFLTSRTTLIRPNSFSNGTFFDFFDDATVISSRDHFTQRDGHALTLTRILMDHDVGCVAASMHPSMRDVGCVAASMHPSMRLRQNENGINS